MVVENENYKLQKCHLFDNYVTKANKGGVDIILFTFLILTIDGAE
jgi:hypothetical protein